MPQKRIAVSRLLLVWFLLVMLFASCSSPTSQPSSTPSLLPSLTLTLTATATASSTATSTPTASQTASLTPTATAIPAARIPIIEYHDPEFRMNDQVQMSLDWFADQMGWLASNGFRTLSDVELVAYLEGRATFPQKSVVLTFDVGTAKKQGYTDVVIPTLKKYGFKAIFFILNNETVIIDPCKPDKRFCWEDFRQWVQEGVVSIGSHGLFHPDFRELTPTQIKYEVEQSRKLLIDNTGREPLGFAYPYDAFSTAAITIVKSAGYQFGVAGNSRKDLSVLVNDSDRYNLPRLYPYSNPRIYPMLTGYNKPFGDVLTAIFNQPVPTVVAKMTSTPQPLTKTALAGTLTPQAVPMTGEEQYLQICRNLPRDSASRLATLLKAAFQPDLSQAARAKLPGFSTAISCNYFGSNLPEAVVLHYTVGDLTSSLSAFRQTGAASSHYIIDRDGKVIQMVPESIGALHSNCNSVRANCLPTCPICDDKDGKLTEPYSRSVGIELVNRGHIPGPTASGAYYEDYLRSFSNYTYWEEYTEAQIASLKVLVEDIASRWTFPVDAQHVLGHYRINYKVDPGPALNLFWSRAGNPPREAIFSTPAP